MFCFHNMRHVLFSSKLPISDTNSSLSMKVLNFHTQCSHSFGDILSFGLAMLGSGAQRGEASVHCRPIGRCLCVLQLRFWASKQWERSHWLTQRLAPMWMLCHIVWAHNLEWPFVSNLCSYLPWNLGIRGRILEWIGKLGHVLGCPHCCCAQLVVLDVAFHCPQGAMVDSLSIGIGHSSNNRGT